MIINFKDPKQASKWFNDTFRSVGCSGLKSDATMTTKYVAQQSATVNDLLEYIVNDKNSWGTVWIKESGDGWCEGERTDYYHGSWCDKNRNIIDFPSINRRLFRRKIRTITTDGGWGCLDYEVVMEPSDDPEDHIPEKVIEVPDLSDVDILKQIGRDGIYYWVGKNDTRHCHPLIDLAGERLVYSWDWLDMSGRDTGSITFLFEHYGKHDNGGWALTEEELLDEPEPEEPEVVESECKIDGNPEKILVKRIKLRGKVIDLGEGVFIKKDYNTQVGALFNIIEAVMDAYKEEHKIWERD